jgi:hypothetical protein
MTRLHFSWRVFAVLASFSVGRSLDSINLDLEVLEQIDLRALGTPNMDRHQGAYDLTVDEACNYLLTVSFKRHEDDVRGDAYPDFEDSCAPNTDTGNAPDGNPWHEPRRHWMQFPQYVFDTTGFDHVSLYWRPCGLPPKGLRQSRYDMNFYTVIPQYRAFWTCQEFKTPKVCQYNQTSFLGRGHFSLPRLARDPDFVANMPLNYQPDPSLPEAYQYEGLVSYNQDVVPETPDAWVLPTFQMNSYDGDVVAWTALLPDTFIRGDTSSISYSTQYFIYQTKPRLPGNWNMTYDHESGVISVLLQGSAGMCGAGFDAAKEEAEQASNGTSRLRG